MRIYWTSSSYPEIREIRSFWQRQVVWWRAFRSATGDNRFVAVVVVTLLVALCGLVVTQLGFAHPIVMAVAVVLITGSLIVTWGGDVIRPHLRRVSDVARHSCPSCGYRLEGVSVEPGGQVQCPECGARMPEILFEDPHAIPRAFLAAPRLAPRERG